MGEFDTKDLLNYSQKLNKIAKSQYLEMASNGAREFQTVFEINKRLIELNNIYNPILTSYDLPFCLSKCQTNTGINLAIFSDSFDLWVAAISSICNSSKYKEYAIRNSLFCSSPDAKGRIVQTNSEAVYGFFFGRFVPSSRTALENALHFDLPILKEVVRKKNWRTKIATLDWRDFLVETDSKH